MLKISPLSVDGNKNAATVYYTNILAIIKAIANKDLYSNNN